MHPVRSEELSCMCVVEDKGGWQVGNEARAATCIAAAAATAAVRAVAASTRTAVALDASSIRSRSALRRLYSAQAALSWSAYSDIRTGASQRENGWTR